MSRISALPGERLHLWLMLALTFTTGINDAVGYLGLDKVFTGNMTGNVVVLGMALTGGTGLPIAGPVLALVAFMVGAAAAGRFLKHGTRTWHGRTTIVFGVVAAIMLVLGVTLLAAGQPSHRLGIVVTSAAALAMGAQAAAARIIAVKDVTTVVVTSTITGLAADSVFGSGKGGGSLRRAGAVVAIIAGAFVGALLLKWHLGTGLILAGVLVAAAAAIGDLHDRGQARGASGQPRATV